MTRELDSISSRRTLRNPDA